MVATALHPVLRKVAMSDNENTEDENIEVTNEVRDIAAKYAWLDDDLSALLCDFIVKKGLHRELLQYLDEMGQTLSG
jgi:selenophosphate synthase